MINKFPKPLRENNGVVTAGYKVYLHKTPSVGNIFWAFSGKGKDRELVHYQVIASKQYKSKKTGRLTLLIYWKDNNGKFYSSGIRSKSLTKIKTTASIDDIKSMCDDSNKPTNCSGSKTEENANA